MMKVGDLVRYTPENKGDLEGVALVIRSDFLPGELEVVSESR